MKAGIAKRSITPPVGIDLTGYIGRPGPSARVHDDIYATAVVLDDGSTKIGIVSMDLLGTSFEMDAAMRKAASQASGIAPENLLITCSHTHAGPAVQDLRGCGNPDESYNRWLYSQVASLVKDACADVTDAKLSFFKAKADLAWNRRSWVIDSGVQQSATSGAITDPELDVLMVSGEGEKPLVMFNYACHGVVLGNDNVEVSADWIGAAKATLEASPSIGTAMFMQGCCGNINPRIRGGFNEVKAAGETVARPLLDAISGAKPIENPAIKVAWKSVDLPFIPLPPDEELEQQVSFYRSEIQTKQANGTPAVAIQVDKAMLSWAEDALSTVNSGGGAETITIGLQVIKIGDLVLAAIPGEVFCEIGLAIREMTSANTMVVGYSNGNIGYVPTAEAYVEGGYEPDNAYKYYGIKMIGPESEGIILQGMKELMAGIL